MNKFPQVLVNVKVKERRPFESDSRISKAISHSNKRLKGYGRLLVRYSGTEPVARVMVEGREEELIKEVADFVASAIRVNFGTDE